MSFLEGGIVQFVVLVLPGLWALWVYSVHTNAPTEESGEITLAKAISFGIAGYLCATTFITKDFLLWSGFSEYTASWLLLPCQFLVSLVATIIVCTIVSRATIKWGNIAYLPTVLLRKAKNKAYPHPPSGNMDYLNSKYFLQKANHTRVVKIYPIGNESHSIIGEVESWNDSGEFILQSSPVISNEVFQNLPADKMQVYLKIVSPDKGYVIEIVNIEEDVITEMYNNQ